MVESEAAAGRVRPEAARDLCFSGSVFLRITVSAAPGRLMPPGACQGPALLPLPCQAGFSSSETHHSVNHPSAPVELVSQLELIEYDFLDSYILLRCVVLRASLKGKEAFKDMQNKAVPTPFILIKSHRHTHTCSSLK